MSETISSPGTPQSFKYWAFITYSHRDKTTGEWLHKSLEAYRIPKQLQGKNTRLGPIPMRFFPIFRDREELAAASDLGLRIEAALREARYLIVICSPSSAASPWVNKEIIFFKSLRRDDRIFSLIADGEPYASSQPGREGEECFPAALRFQLGPDGKLSTRPAEPLAADAREDKDGKRNALLKLMAGMLEVGFDSLRQRDLEQRNARLRRFVGVSALLVLIFAALAVYAFRQQQLAEQRSRVASSRQLAVESRSLLNTSPDLPLLLSLEALSAESTVEARRSLFEALVVNRRPISLLSSPVNTHWNSVVATRDGKTLVTGGHEGQILFWDLTNDPPQTQLVQAHSGDVRGLSLSQDGKLMASAGVDGKILFWDMGDRRILQNQSISRQQEQVTAVAFGPNNLVAFGTSGQGFGANKITLWDVNGHRPINTLDPSSDGSVSSLVFSPDGKTLASAAVGGDTILWDISSGSRIHDDFLKDTGSLAFSPDGKWLASGSWQLTLRNVSDFHPVQFTLPDAPTHINDVEFSPDGRYLASAAFSGNVVTWDPVTRRPVEGPFQFNLGSIEAMTFSPDGRRLFAAAENRMAVVALGASPLRRDLRFNAYVSAFAFHPWNGVLVLSADHGGLAFYDPVTLKPSQKSSQQAEPVRALELSHDGTVLVTGSSKGRITFWNPLSAQPISQPVKVAPDNIEGFSFSPDGHTLAIIPLGREVLLWDVNKQQLYPVSVKADPEFVRAAVFLKDGNKLVTAGDHQEIIRWDWRTGRPIGSPLKTGEGVDALALSPSGDILAAGDYGGKVTLWDTSRWQMIGVALAGHTNMVRTVAFSPDGQLLASGGDDGVVILWDVTSRQPIAQFRHGATVLSGDGTARTPRSVNRLSFSPDGRTLAADGPENEIILWDIDISSWKRQACRIVSRNLTAEEWERYIGDRISYSETCPGGVPRPEAARKRFLFW